MRKNEAISKYSEPGLLTWLANTDSVEVVSPEPDETKELEYLLAQGFEVPEIMTYYFGRQMYQWFKRDHVHNKDWKSYAERHVGSYSKLKPFLKNELTLDIVLQMFKDTTHRVFSTGNEKLLYSISDPTTNNVSAASGIFRDISLCNAITKAWQSGKDVFALYGSGHAIILEKALIKLTKTDGL